MTLFDINGIYGVANVFEFNNIPKSINGVR